MKKGFYIFTLILGFGLLTADSSAQSGCKVLKDSILASKNGQTGEYSVYFYDGQDRLNKVFFHNPMGNILGYDTFYYNGSGEYVKLEHYNRNGSNYDMSRFTGFIYTAGKVSRVEARGLGNNAWTM